MPRPLLKDKILKELRRLGMAKSREIDLIDEQPNSIRACLSELYKLNLVERENKGSEDFPVYEYSLSDQGRKVLDNYDNYREFAITRDFGLKSEIYNREDD